MKIPIADLHCDLLTYLANGASRTALDKESRCSIPSLKNGNVLLQTMAIFTEGTESSYIEGKKQAEIFCKLQNEEDFSPLIETFPHAKKIQLIASIENASSFLAEHESIKILGKRLQEFKSKLGKILYVSFTWNGENRFGGGALTHNVGLKNDGKELLRLLHKTNIAIDLSHASDKLAFEILNLIDQESLQVQVIASHSNCREVHLQERNLPDDLIVEIIRRKGLIGLNFVRHFIDEHSFNKLKCHAEHILKRGGEDVLAIGADFFAAEDLPPERYRLHASWYFEGYEDAGDLQKALKIIQEATGSKSIEKVAHKNVTQFIKRTFYA